jgi:hypothetical protein
MRQMSWTPQPQPQRLTAAALDVLGVSKIIQAVRPFLVTGHYKAHCRRLGRSLNTVQ